MIAIDSEVRVSGPFTHENLSVFVLCSATQDGRDFLTLDEGLKSGEVAVTDKGEVNELLIENRSDRPLFLQEGDRVTGGKQDRMVHTSLVVPARSGQMPLPAFCVEHGRWRGSSEKFCVTQNPSIATKNVRIAGKVQGSQQGVWDRVAREKALTHDAVGALSATSSLNETLDSPEARKVSEAALQALGGALAGKDDALGVAFAVNGKIEEVDLYPGRPLLAKLYPRLLAAYAIDAANRKGAAKETPPLAGEDVARFMKASESKGTRREQVNAENSVVIEERQDKFACQTDYEGKPVHRQMLAK